jgi:arabinofuranosyltransferase
LAARPSPAGLDRTDLLLLAVGGLVVAVFLRAEHRIALTPGLPLDDAWIHLRLADNVATGGGFGINRGEPVAASTAPLWSLALAGLLALGVPALVAAKALGLACWAATSLVTRRLAGAVGLGPVLAAGAGLAVVGLSRLIWGALSGMEVSLAALCVAVAAWAIVRERPGPGAALLGLATLVRPEAALLAGLHVLGAPGWGEAFRRAALAAAVVTPGVVFNLVTGGRVVPVSAAAKVEGGLLGQAEGLADAWGVAGRLVIEFLRDWGRLLFEDHVALPVLLAVGLIAARAGRLRWLAATLVLHPLAMALVAPYRGPSFQTGRYSSHLLPLAVVVALIGLDRLLSGIPAPRLRVLVLGLLVLGLAWRLPAAAESYGWGVENINAMQVRLGHWVAAHTPPDTLIALNDVGALTYFGKRRVIDLVGLATPEVLPYRRRGPDALLRYLGQRCPEYLVIFPAWFPGLATRADLFRPVTGVTLPHNVVAGAATMTVYETAWHRGPASAPRPCPAATGGGAPGQP